LPGSCDLRRQRLTASGAKIRQRAHVVADEGIECGWVSGTIFEPGSSRTPPETRPLLYGRGARDGHQRDQAGADPGSVWIEKGARVYLPQSSARGRRPHLSD